LKPRVTARLDEALYAAVRELGGERTIDAVVNAALQLWVERQRASVPAVAAVDADALAAAPDAPAPTPMRSPAPAFVVPADQLPRNIYRPPGRTPPPRD
jgi:hypothetical protein